MSAWPLRRVRFSLRTLFVVLTLAVIPVWWAGTHIAARRAAAAYQEAYAMWEAEMVTADEVSQKSHDLMNAELRVPLADRRAARERHLERVTLVWRKLDALRIVGNFGDPPAFAREVERFKQTQVDEAQRAVDESK
jgi:hypothetical protein